jgi:hypothetical protein
MQNDLFQIFNTIFSQPPQLPKSIFLEIDILNNETQLSDIFEIYLNMLVYGFTKLHLDLNQENILILEKYFNSIGIKILIEFDIFDTILFKDTRYINRYCIIDSSSFTNLESNPLFIMNINQTLKKQLVDFIAIYQIDYEYLVYIRFDFI